jgi:hypothetical protein
MPERHREANGYSIGNKAMFNSALVLMREGKLLSRFQCHFVANRETENLLSLEVVS